MSHDNIEITNTSSGLTLSRLRPNFISATRGHTYPNFGDWRPELLRRLHLPRRTDLVLVIYTSEYEEWDDLLGNPLHNYCYGQFQPHLQPIGRRQRDPAAGE
jgi:hypothetical protein